jgi:AraC-like DNA-binding protein
MGQPAGQARHRVPASCDKQCSVPSNRPTLREVQGAICDRLHAGAMLHVEDIAESLYVSKSTLQRTLADLDTTFTQLRRQVQVEVAIKRLTGGASCTSTAAYVGLSSDHMCKLVAEYADLTPRQIVRACQLAGRVQRWRRSVPPRANTKLYFKQLERWRAIDAEIEQLVAGLASGHPLAAWAHKLRQSTQRPDYRRGRYRTRVRAQRRRDEVRFMALLRQAATNRTQWQREQDSKAATEGDPIGGAASHV